MYLATLHPNIPVELRETVVVATLTAARVVAKTHNEVVLEGNNDRSHCAEEAMKRWSRQLSGVEPCLPGGPDLQPGVKSLDLQTSVMHSSLAVSSPAADGAFSSNFTSAVDSDEVVPQDENRVSASDDAIVPHFSNDNDVDSGVDIQSTDFTVRTTESVTATHFFVGLYFERHV